MPKTAKNDKNIQKSSSGSRKGRKFNRPGKRREKKIDLLKKNRPFPFRIPRTSFSCRNRAPGYYADMEADCQVSSNNQSFDYFYGLNLYSWTKIAIFEISYFRFIGCVLQEEEDKHFSAQREQVSIKERWFAITNLEWLVLSQAIFSIAI